MSYKKKTVISPFRRKVEARKKMHRVQTILTGGGKYSGRTKGMWYFPPGSKRQRFQAHD